MTIWAVYPQPPAYAVHVVHLRDGKARTAAKLPATSIACARALIPAGLERHEAREGNPAGLTESWSAPADRSVAA